MRKRPGVLCSVAVLAAPCAAIAGPDHPYRKPPDFKTLEPFKSVADFEASMAKYVRHCLDNKGGGTGGISCFTGAALMRPYMAAASLDTARRSSS